MRRLLLALLLLVMAQTPALAAGGLSAFLHDLNVQAHADINGYTARVAAQFGVPEAQVRIVLGKVTEPADAFMVFELGRISRRDADSVLRVYQTNRRGWGAIAHDLGIKPGSPEFKALKRGQLHLGDVDEAPAGHGRGHKD